MAPAYDETQICFTLSMLSYLGAVFIGDPATIETALSEAVPVFLDKMQPLLGSWELAWGPVVSELPGSCQPDNTMFVVRGTTAAGGSALPPLPALIIAIAGTNPISFLDWMVEDFYVRKQVPWPAAPGAMISGGTDVGLRALQAMRPGRGLAGAGRTVSDFLAAEMQAGPVSLTVTGHSLGGALAPTLALWLHDTREAWDPQGNASLAVLPFAGPTAGNQAFARYSDAQIGGRVTRVHNSCDVVPRVWAQATLQPLADLYAPDIEPDAALDLVVELLQTISGAGGYTQINAGAPALAGTVNTSIILPALVPSLVSFLSQAIFQHVDAYFDLLRVHEPSLDGLLQQLKANGPSISDLLARLRNLSNRSSTACCCSPRPAGLEVSDLLSQLFACTSRGGVACRSSPRPAGC